MLRKAPVHPNAENATLDELSVAMEAAPSKRSYIRLAAVRSLLLGIPRATVGQQFCRTDRMVRLWIELFNRGGIDALITRPKPGRPRRRWVQPGRPRTVPCLGDHVCQNIIGAVAPHSGELFSLIVDGVGTDVFQFFLDEMARAVPRKACGKSSFWTTPRGISRHGSIGTTSSRSSCRATRRTSTRLSGCGCA